MKRIVFICIVLLSALSGLQAQDHHKEATYSTTHSNHQKHHSLALYTAFTHIPGAFYEHETHESRSGKFVPTFGLDYYYHLSPKFSAGLMMDLEFDDYYIHEGEEQLIRDNIWVAAIVGKYKIAKYIEFFAGPGYEMERKRSGNERESVSLWLMRVGIEFPVPIEKDWYLAPSFLFDYKEEYHSYSFGLSILKHF